MDYVKLEQWRKLATQLSAIKNDEMKLRKELFKEGFIAPVEGANTIELQDGWMLKATVPYTRALDQEKVPEVLKELKKAKAPATLIRAKYELSIADYRKLDDKQQALVDAILTTKPGAPSLELIPPKSM